MKKFVAMLLCLSMVFSLFGCTSNKVLNVNQNTSSTNVSSNYESSAQVSSQEEKSSSDVETMPSSSKAVSSAPEIRQIESYDLTYATTKNVQDTLNLRSQPNTNSEVLKTISSGSMFYITGKMNNNWYKVNCSNIDGYVSCDYAEFSPITMYINTATTLENTQVNIGTEVKVISKNGNNSKIKYNNKLYTIKSSILSENMTDTMIDSYKNTLLATFSTNYSTIKAQYNRNTNITIAAQTINGKIIKSKSIFNWNQIVGATTKEKGYKLAPVIANGQTAYDYGGGICQVSSTLYNVALESNFEIIERHPHSHIMAYMHGKPDATIAYPTLNLIFRNTLNSPVLISAYAKDGTIKISFYELTSK